ncbi:MAG: hypothetical protein M1831_001226 [Alyxoria varia]|nr:MAG: hypothetical protein M1831_001226 [Alyxoria varia]
MASGDPLRYLPVEINLNILGFLDIPSLARLSRASKAWNHFINHVHQDPIYAYQAGHTPNANHEFDKSHSPTTYTRYYQGVTSWKDACKRQYLMHRNWSSESPIIQEHLYDVSPSIVWRFRPDFERRFFISTSQSGGLFVTDMDTGRRLWQRSWHEVRPYAHLEYSNGYAAFDKENDGIEIWKADENVRGKFNEFTVLSHNCVTRGFQLTWPSLCVVSTEGRAFHYNLEEDTIAPKTVLSIEHDAVGHLDQNDESVMFSLGEKGYHIYRKETGECMGALNPIKSIHIYYIEHSLPEVTPDGDLEPMQNESKKPHERETRFTRVLLRHGHHPHPDEREWAEHDEWGACLFWKNFVVGISQNGRLFICSDWQGALKSKQRFEDTCAVVECEADPEAFHFGGWLSVRNGKVLFEVRDRLYLLPLPGYQDRSMDATENFQEWHLPISSEIEKNGPKHVRSEEIPILSFSLSGIPRLPVPVSWMGLYDDCIMTTYGRIVERVVDHDMLAIPQRVLLRNPGDSVPRGIMNTKGIRVISFARHLNPKGRSLEEQEATEKRQEAEHSCASLKNQYEHYTQLNGRASLTRFRDSHPFSGMNLLDALFTNPRTVQARLDTFQRHWMQEEDDRRLMPKPPKMSNDDLHEQMIDMFYG